MEITPDQLRKLIPSNPHADKWCDVLNQLLPNYQIDTPQRVAAFIAQCAHESMNFMVLKENLNYRWETLRAKFKKYFPTDELAQQYASLPNKREAIASRIYANRMGNGPEESGDGFRYCGRGLIQITGKQNYSQFADSVGMSVEEASDYLQTFEGAAQAACWYWDVNQLNDIADTGDMVTLTRRINGGTNGLEDRIQRYNDAMKVLNA